MENSKKLQSNNRITLLAHVGRVLRHHLQPGAHLVVGLSGGVDSVVLLDLLGKLSPKLRFSLAALHINHGISHNADTWEKFCIALCRQRDIPLQITRHRLKKSPGNSLEAVARTARYTAYAAQTADYIVLAQHLDDQAETLLLQLLRGAGVKGLAAMPVIRGQRAEGGLKHMSKFHVPLSPRGRGQGRGGAEAVINKAPDLKAQILRPLLDVSRAEIEAYATQKKLRWITDESNADIAYDRNFLRHEVLTIIEKRYPTYRATLMRTSRHLAEAADLLDELAIMDGGNALVKGKLQLSALRKLNATHPLRAKNLLRYYLSQHAGPSPSTAKLAEILRQLSTARADAKLHLAFGDTEIRIHKSAVVVKATQFAPDQNWRRSLDVPAEKKISVPELGGLLSFTRKKGAGISLQKLQTHPATLRLRQGGERIRPDAKRPRRSLKNLLQEAALPAWERAAVPLLFCGEQLVWVPEIGVDSAFQAQPDEMGWVIKWRQNRGKNEG